MEYPTDQSAIPCRRRMRCCAWNDVITSVADPVRAWIDADMAAQLNELTAKVQHLEDQKRSLLIKNARLNNRLENMTEVANIHMQRAEGFAEQLQEAQEELSTTQVCLDQVRRYAVDLEVSFAPRYFERQEFQRRLHYPEPPELNGQVSEDWIDYYSEVEETDPEDM